MSKLNLEAFKARISLEEQENIEELVGGILGDCHCVNKWNYEDNNVETVCT